MSSAISGIRAARQELAAQRDKLDLQIGALDAALQTMGAAPAVSAASSSAPAARGGRGRRGPRSGSLKEYVLRVLSGRNVMRVKDIAAGVVSAGYPTKNKTLAKSVGIALRDLRNVKQVGRGRFRLA